MIKFLCHRTYYLFKCVLIGTIINYFKIKQKDKMDANTLEGTLKNQQWVGGQQPTQADVEAFETLKNENLSAAAHPHVFAWFCLVSKFTDVVRKTWTAAAGGAAKGGKGGKKDNKKKEEDDDLDLFGDDNEDDAAAAAAIAANAKKAAKPKKVVIA
jgi:elongation factor 1-beta